MSETAAMERRDFEPLSARWVEVKSRAIDGEFSIGELCELLNLTHRALRFWEMQGLVSSVRRGNRRYYSREAVERLRQIVKLKSLEFTLVEIKRLLGSSFDPDRMEVELNRETIDQHLDYLNKMKQRFEHAIAELSALSRDNHGEIEGVMATP